jgi:hypothetical protein
MPNYFMKHGPTVRITSGEEVVITDFLPAGNYLVKFDMMSGFYLESMDPFTLPSKMYGNHSKDADRIISTFNSRSHSTGSIFCGEKGSGKTMLTKLISRVLADAGVPTLIINNAYHGDAFNGFLSKITQPCVVLFDEFEKVYSEEDQQHILTLMDGVYDGKKLFLLTCNNKWKVNEHMRNRPGRIFYMLEYEGLDQDFIREFCEDMLLNKTHINAVCMLTNMFTKFNFDMLQALIEEMNRYDESPSEALRLLNCKPDVGTTRSFTYVLKVKGSTVKANDLDDDGEDPAGEWRGSPMAAAFSIGYYKKVGKKKEQQYANAKFSPNDLVHMDVAKDQFLFKNQAGDEITLIPKLADIFDYRSALNRVGPDGSYSAQHPVM